MGNSVRVCVRVCVCARTCSRVAVCELRVLKHADLLLCRVTRELELVASNALKDLKVQTQAKLDNAIQKHINMRLDIDIQVQPPPFMISAAMRMRILTPSPI